MQMFDVCVDLRTVPRKTCVMSPQIWCRPEDGCHVRCEVR